MADKAVGVQEPTRTEDLGLHTKVLGDLPVLGQSIAGIGPTIGAVSLIALVFADAGHGTWLTVVIASIGVLAVAVCIAHVAGSHFPPAPCTTWCRRGWAPRSASSPVGSRC